MFKDILLPVDLQENLASEKAAAVARDFVERCNSKITVMTVIPDFGLPLVAGYFPDDAMQEAKKDVCKELKRFVETHFTVHAVVKTEVCQGSPHKMILRYAQNHSTDLIVLPARAKDVSKIFLGSSSTQVVERAPCSVLVVRPETALEDF